jgi:formyltetrahydrofolate synthetase
MTDHEKPPVALIGSEDTKLDGAVTVSEVVSDAIYRAVIEGQEAWVRTGTEPHLRSVAAVKNEGGGWSVAVAVMEFVRPEHAAYQELLQAIEDAIESVPGVTEVEREVNEGWWASGTPSGEDLARAVADVLDEHADRLRDHYDTLTPGTAFP